MCGEESLSSLEREDVDKLHVIHKSALSWLPVNSIRNICTRRVYYKYNIEKEPHRQEDHRGIYSFVQPLSSLIRRYLIVDPGLPTR